MIVEIYGLKCFFTGAFLCLIAYKKWIKFNKPKTYVIKEIMGLKNHP